MPVTTKFDYTKSTGEVSKREVVLLNSDNSRDLLLTVDVTNLAKTDIKDVAESIAELRRDFLNKVYAVAHNYGVEVKTFKHSGISNKKSEDIG